MNMHGDEKSDEGVVPEKRPNNGSLLPAEAVEGRTSPKGNGGRTAAVRTQSRAAASNGLAAVRQAARQSKGVRFTALLHRGDGSVAQQGAHWAPELLCRSPERPKRDLVFSQVKHLWRRALGRRSQRASLNWEKFSRLVDRFFPPIRILHPLPCHRFDARTRGRSPVR
jgi:hypothetical protein